MYDVKCPICDHIFNVRNFIPVSARDENETDCPKCKSIILVGYFVQAEVRGVVKDNKPCEF